MFAFFMYTPKDNEHTQIKKDDMQLKSFNINLVLI